MAFPQIHFFCFTKNGKSSENSCFRSDYGEFRSDLPFFRSDSNYFRSDSNHFRSDLFSRINPHRTRSGSISTNLVVGCLK